MEKTRISVEIALISGVMPRRRRDQISSGSVLSRPIRKKLTAISSSDSVKISKPAAISDTRRFGSVMRQNVLPVICAQVERGFFLRALEFLQSGENFRGGYRD